jgi:hypothetical protein
MKELSLSCDRKDQIYWALMLRFKGDECIAHKYLGWLLRRHWDELCTPVDDTEAVDLAKSLVAKRDKQIMYLLVNTRLSRHEIEMQSDETLERWYKEERALDRE